jgi:hypothetical protein
VPCRLAASSKYELFVRVFIGSNPGNYNYYFADYMRITSLATTLFIACGSRCLPVAAVQRVQPSRREGVLRRLHGICNFFLATATTPLYPCHGYHLPSCRTARLTTKIAAKPFPPYSDSSYIVFDFCHSVCRCFHNHPWTHVHSRHEDTQAWLRTAMICNSDQSLDCA